MIGKVKWFDRNYGFIAPDDGGNDVFIHRRTVEMAGLMRLAEGQKLRFDVRPSARRGGRMEAVNIEAIVPAPVEQEG
jgi:CspA family cold shock protein